MNGKVLNKNHVFINLDLKTQDEVFKYISKKAFELGYISNEKTLLKGFKKREAESTTGFEDGFAIPHARIKEIIKPAVFYIKLKNEINWNSLDGKGTDVILALLIPDTPTGQVHLELLSSLAVKIMNENVKKELKNPKNVSTILNTLSEKERNKSDTVTKSKVKVVGITACVTGIAHTYMAEEKMLKAGQKIGVSVRIETQGSKGVGNKLSNREIEEADVVILATDTSVEMERFVGKKVYAVKVSEAIKDPVRLINRSLEEGKIFEAGKNEGFNNEKGKKTAVNDRALNHILAGISYMIPMIVLGGICLAFSLGLAKAIWGPESGTSGPNGEYKWGILAILDSIGGAAFALMIPVLAGFIANSIAGRAAIAPAMLGAFIGNDNTKLASWIPGMDIISTPMGFIGAIISGLAVGYYVRWVNTWKVPKSLAPAMPIFFIPLTAGIAISIIFIYVLGAPIGYLMDQIQTGIEKAYNSGNIGILVGLGLGLILGAMAGFDMGGPINKIAFITCSALITAGVQQPMGAMSAAIPVAPLGMGLSTILFKRFYSEEEKGMGIAAMIMGTIGISEGAIPFAIRDPKRAIVCNVLGSAVAGGIAGAFMITDAAAHGGPIVAILGAVPYGPMTVYYFIAVAAGVAVTTSTYGIWQLKDAGAFGSVKEAHILHLEELKSKKFENIKQLKLEIKTLKEQNYSEEKINFVKEKIAKINEQYKLKVQIAKENFKPLNIKEKEFIKQSTLKKDIKLISQKYNEQINQLKVKKAASIKNLSKNEAKSNNEIIFKEIKEIKEIKEKEIKNYNINLRKKYKEEYLNRF
ncbi:PTS fructose transporter subunit IIABC [Mesoplasma tabanidae]|uniref:PTS system, fructose-specific IIABC component n=1 Tax=Mesoplasma tabanidae TaxID=219745 RepID=A0A2K8P561_9MOLU|nr:fructose-specific PTS transporter subunit EIIC [Mesoplasma tabanidae]ATZ21891.1 PTS system, fructose-specific IIABC component [Mesoplasma tabanidae]